MHIIFTDEDGRLCDVPYDMAVLLANGSGLCIKTVSSDAFKANIPAEALSRTPKEMLSEIASCAAKGKARCNIETNYDNKGGNKHGR